MTANSPDFVTVVSGLPRSGTSMMMQMLHAGGMPVLTDRLRVADDDNPRGYYELEAVKQTERDPSWLANARGSAVKVIYRLLEDLPASTDYRVIFMHRPLEEVIASQQVMLHRRGKAGADVSHKQLAQIFENEIQRVQRWLAKQEHFKLFDLQYAEVLSGAQTAAQRVRDFLEFPLNVPAMVEVVDQRLYHQRGR